MAVSGQQPGTNSTGIILQIIANHYGSALRVAIAAAALVGVAGFVYATWLQPTRRSYSLEFRPTFTGADSGQYPNGLPFSVSEVADSSILDIVYDTNEIAQYCGREVFRGGFFVEQRSAQSISLDAEYQGRLEDPRVSSIERQRLQDEYQAKREALPMQYRLVFTQPQACASIPGMVVTKCITDVLTTWADESDTKRGVLNHNVEVLTPAMLDSNTEASSLLRADLLRTSLWRVIVNIEEVARLPGASQVRLPATDSNNGAQISFTEIRHKLTDLVRSTLEPLVVLAAQSMERESLAWVTETVSSAERSRHAAEGRAAAYLAALREYSGMQQSAASARTPGTIGQSPTNSSDVQTISPQVDLSFIDRIVEMSEANTAYRRELTTSMVKATVEAVAAEERAGYYRRLLAALRESNTPQITPADIEQSLTDITDRGKFHTRQYNDLFTEFSRVSLRSSGSMYQVEKPVTAQTFRGLSYRGVLLMTMAAFVAGLLLAFVALALRSEVRATAAQSKMS